ncbi:hypothetical protein [Pseudofrankia sp. DC12]|uniref:hypothetical protein n=1 Tax=Pseudofrankia sp. DC12 TaxID=683315 RepID=UPI000A55DC1B|nr:hypothetical protein [Pseudofrankia sp. DC12]
MTLGAVVALAHLLAHLSAFGGPPSGPADLVAGNPLAAAVFIGGAVAAGRRQ